MMTTYQVDPDVARWGLHLIDMCSLSNDGSPHTLTCYVEDFSRTQSVTEGFFNPNVENDEVIAHALQDDLSRPSDGSVFMYAGKKYLNGPNGAVARDWVEPSALDSHSEFQSSQEEEKKEAVLTNLEGLSVESEQQGTFPEIEDESDIDGELGKRLNRMVAVPHVPKINGDLPSTDEESSDHQRLMDRLQVYELTELKILGDGNCQFRSLSDQIYRTPEHHKFVREQVVSQLKSQPELYDNYVPMAYSDYLKKMNKSGEWGDHVTLQAAADCYGIKIFVITSFKDTCYIEILPQCEKSNRIIFLSFWAEVHYNSIYPVGEVPMEEDKKKRRWWP